MIALSHYNRYRPDDVIAGWTHVGLVSDSFEHASASAGV
jgi:hypothetical protein